MIVTLSGSNSYGLQRELQTLVKKFVQEHGELAVERHDGEEASFEAIKESLLATGLLANYKLVVLRQPSLSKTFIENAEQLLSQVDEATQVIVVEPKLDKRTAYAKYLQKKTDFKTYNELDERQLADWLISAAAQQKGKLSRSDAQFLIERVGPNQSLLASELDKLLLYAPQITRDNINLLVEPLPQSSIFELLDAAFSGDLPKALRLYDEQRTLKVEPQQIIAMLAWQLHILAIVKTAKDKSPQTIAADSHLHPFVVQKNIALARHITTSYLKQLIHEVLELDVRIKTTSIDANQAVMALLAAIAAAQTTS